MKPQSEYVRVTTLLASDAVHQRQPIIRDHAIRQLIIDVLRQQEGLKRKLKELLDQ
jgi:hypothetical protein